MNIVVLIVAACCLLSGLAGCVPPAGEAHAAVEGGAVVPAGEDARLHGGDRVQVTVFGEDGVSGSYEVTPSGILQLPLAGPVPALGKTTRDLEAAIALALRRTYLRDPKVTVALLSQRPFYVLGEVEKPGEYPYRAGLNLWRALAVAGGQTYRASSSTVMIQHAGEARLAEYDIGYDLVIQPGDLIRVPERWF
ncbi:polysaccharide export protein [Lichenihabitans sp. Uapishka_5]|uniref:polysaccharide biosynthesis/export family protein n=1 Tax=Lichenihabitans sp. Uapishka_5 TaxID=3037302 RepID=UPI0029E8076D|nr:polysaccharide biosynthesis/export family protein [Lichenihabitans sp. Uapishka_5]MDX7953518.1 polysaccharide export protein [Lichenihabitans sp. Uapishka_5]